jgi:hypothetical protein
MVAKKRLYSAIKRAANASRWNTALEPRCSRCSYTDPRQYNTNTDAGQEPRT